MKDFISIRDFDRAAIDRLIAEAEGIDHHQYDPLEMKGKILALLFFEPSTRTRMSFEAAMGELESIVRRLESGDVSLEESVALYERGHALRTHCEARLAAAQARIEQVSLNADGQPAGTTPFGES